MLQVDVVARSASPFASPASPASSLHLSSTSTSTLARDIEAMESHASATLASFHLRLPDGTSPRPSSCVRPPCLKRSTNASGSPTREQSSLLSPTWPAAFDQPSVASGSKPIAELYSFSTPRCIPFSKKQASRQVHFDSSPPTAFDTFSADDYDRSQIECTQGGSDFDLRLPSKCKRYNGDGEEESDDDTDSGPASGMDSDADDASSTASSSSNSSRSGPFGGSGWACLRKGSLIGSLHSPRPPACKSTNDTSSHHNASLPVHGVRSFGGLARHDDASTTHIISNDDHKKDKSMDDSTDGIDDGDSDIVCDDDAVMEAAAIASLPTKSPNATPKPSPSIIPRWSRCTDYFQCSPMMDTTPRESAVSTPHPDIGSSHMAVSLSASSSASSEASMKTMTPDVASPPACMAIESEEVQDASTQATYQPERLCAEEQTPRARQTPIMPPSESCFSSPIADSVSRNWSPEESMTAAGEPESPSPRPLISRAAPFGDMISAETSSGHLSPSPSCDGSVLLSALSGMQFGPAGSDQTHSTSTPSPLSSRCSSIDPWSGFSNSGDEDTNGTSSPCAEWSSCTSPELTPAMLGVTSPDPMESSSKQITPSTTITSPSGVMYDVDGGISSSGEGERLPSPATDSTAQTSATLTSEVLNGANTLLEAEKASGRSRSRSRSNVLMDEARSSTTSPPSTDEEIPRRRTPIRSSSSSSSSRRSSSSLGCSPRSSSLCMSSMTKMSSTEEGDSGAEPPPTRPRSKSRSNSARSSGSAAGSNGNGGKVKKMPVWRRDSFEDEGALGGF